MCINTIARANNIEILLILNSPPIKDSTPFIVTNRLLLLFNFSNVINNKIEEVNSVPITDNMLNFLFSTKQVPIENNMGIKNRIYGILYTNLLNIILSLKNY